MNKPESITIPTGAGPLAGLLHLPSNIPAPVIVCCHGMLSSKDSKKFAFIAEHLSTLGLAALRFDFSGCGESQARLAGDLLSSRMRDLHAVLDYSAFQPWNNGTLGLLGSSLGGYLSLLVRASERHPLDVVICWATPFDLSRIRLALEVSEELQSFFPPGFGLGFPENLASLAPIKGVLIIHGEQDQQVPWTDAVKIYRRVEDPKRLLIVKDADHRFLDPSCRALALKASVEWLRERGLMPA